MPNTPHAPAAPAPTRSPAHAPGGSVRKAAHLRSALALLQAAQRSEQPDPALAHVTEQVAALLATLDPYAGPALFTL